MGGRSGGRRPEAPDPIARAVALQRALAIFGRAFGPRSHEVGVNLAGLAGVNLARGRHADARDGYRRALAIHRRLFGADHPSTRACAANLARLSRA